MLSTVSDPASKPAKKRSNKAADNASQPAKLSQKSTTEINKATSKLSQKSTTEINKATSKLSQKSTTEINKSKDKKDKIKDSEDELMPGCDPLAHCLESKPTGLLLFQISSLKLLLLWCSSTGLNDLLCTAVKLFIYSYQIIRTAGKAVGHGLYYCKAKDSYLVSLGEGCGRRFP